MVFTFNFHATQSFTGYRIGVPAAGRYRVVLDSDDKVRSFVSLMLPMYSVSSSCTCRSLAGTVALIPRPYFRAAPATSMVARTPS
jgi:hypothetical protein